MKSSNCKFPVAALLIIASAASVAGGSAQHSSQAIAHSMEALGYSMVAGVQLVSGAAAIQLGIAGELGTLSGTMSEELWEAASVSPDQAFPNVDEVVTSGPTPSEAIEDDTQ